MVSQSESGQAKEQLGIPGIALRALVRAVHALTQTLGLDSKRQAVESAKEKQKQKLLQVGEKHPPAPVEAGKGVSGTCDDGQTQEKREPAKMDTAEAHRQYRERLAKDMRREMALRGGGGVGVGVGVGGGGGGGRSAAAAGPSSKVYPIQEEGGSGSTSTPSASSEQTAISTESGNTIRGGMTTPGLPARTPSYPFPSMRSPGPTQLPMYRAFGTLPSSVMSPPGSQWSPETSQLQDRVLSDSSTPVSGITFLPQGLTRAAQESAFPSPNLYDLSLMLSAEPGMNAWWNTVVQIMTEVYRAERVTLAVPADPSDIENVPWGQKATFNAHHEDDYSVGYLARGSSLIHSSIGGDVSEPHAPQVDESTKQGAPASRPGLLSRHSFTSYEDKKEKKNETPEKASPASRRPNLPSRSVSFYPTILPNEQGRIDPGYMGLNKKALEEHDALEDQQPAAVPSWEVPLTAQEQGRGMVLDVLQALNYEADPLIDHNGVMRVMERGKVIALTRSYPYLSRELAENKPPQPGKHSSSGTGKSTEAKKKTPLKSRAEFTPKLSTLLGNAKLSTPASRLAKAHLGEKAATTTSAAKTNPTEEHEYRPTTPKYEEYEQAPPSPWSQSPAPSPAIRADPNENPFFADATVDEESFNPTTGPQDYAAMQPPEAIGVDNAWTVLHIPLTHAVVPKPRQQPLRAATGRKQGAAGQSTEDPSTMPAHPMDSPFMQKHAPIAILSILSPIIPYPSNLRHSLEHLAPHLANSFSLSRHYTTLETELSGLQLNRRPAMGFGAVGADGRPRTFPTALASTDQFLGEDTVSQSSLAGSITSPSEKSGPFLSAAASPSGTPTWDVASFGFISEKRPLASSPAPTSGESYFSAKSRVVVSPGEEPRPSRLAKESPTAEKRASLRLSGGKGQWLDYEPSSPLAPELQQGGDKGVSGPEDLTTTKLKLASPKEHREQLIDLKGEKAPGGAEMSRRSSVVTTTSQHRHTQLHAHGAEFSSTFQSLTPSAFVGKGASTSQPSSRSGSVSQIDMIPPSDKLKSLILDSLPVHVFVAMPQTGEIVWVNSRLLTYRGQTASDLAVDPWGSIHADDREEYLQAWSHSVRTGESFSRTVRIRRFDGQYRWFYARAVASKDKRGVIPQFLGSFMDIHEQHIAELKAARQEEIEESEAKHRLLANLIPQIIFTATEGEGVTFANDQWLSYTGQNFEDALGIGFIDFVHPDDLAKCRVPIDSPPSPLARPGEKASETEFQPPPPPIASDTYIRGIHQVLSRHNSSSSSSMYELPAANLTELSRRGVVKVSIDSNGRLSYTTEIRLRSKSGEYRWHLIRCVEIENINLGGGKGESSYFGSATDINDLKLMETKLKDAMESKGRFLSNMSHEIRTPLIGISGMVSFLQDTTLNEEQRDYTNTIQTSANSLLMIINDILDLSKVDAGMMKLNFEWFHTRSLIEDVNELVSTMAIAKRLELNYVVDEDVPSWIKGDRVRIRQVLLNVIGNAIKFTSEGEVFSHCRVFVPEKCEEPEKLGPSVESNEIVLEFSVIDTGRGFTKEEAELIFKPFSQIDGSSTRQHGGSGLGLVISRQLAELHGGTMDGQAIPGKGSTFRFTAKFGLPTEADHPDAPLSSQPAEETVKVQAPPESPKDTPPPPGNILPGRTPVDSPATIDTEFVSPPLPSSDSSDPSVRSARSFATTQSSMSSINAGLVRFSEAARASGQDLSQMKLEMPSGRSSPGSTPTVNAERLAGALGDLRPTMYSILVISPQTHSREATTKHIETTLPKNIPHKITALASAEEAYDLIGGDDPSTFTHIVINLPSPDETINLMDRIASSSTTEKTTVVILTDSVQRQAVVKQVAGTSREEALSESRVTYVYKPVKPSRFAVIFDPAQERDLSIDRNKSTAQRLVETQRQSYLEVERRLGHRGHKVLLVEDNPVNQKVLQKYLWKVGVEVDLAIDGAECTDMVLARDHAYYSLILCDLHMPRKDGYQACREIRDWEAKNNMPRMPILALSANVMSDVQQKCMSAGFDDYITKPVDFVDLSNTLSGMFKDVDRK